MRLLSKNIGKRLEGGKKGLFWSLTCLVLLITATYIYLMNTTAQNGVRWGRAQEEIASIDAAVSELESEYLSLKQSITLSMAYARGFEDVKAVKFISTKRVGAVVTANEI